MADASTPMRHNGNDLMKKAHNEVILKEHSAENLLSLLSLCTPQLSIDHIYDDTVRMAAMKKLIIAIHPNNFPYNEDGQCIYEDIQRFYDLCCQNITESKNGENQARNIFTKSVRKRRRRKNVSPTSVVEMVVQCEFFFVQFLHPFSLSLSFVVCRLRLV